ncbi:protein O-mannosyl-transferase family [Taibaiella chishuiensis]|uniref:Uncharacterized protein DUF2723 n=1 Tax=Taibaiella chishuiensis TaxID=1434707 RepID=A0A2P8DCR2_9BACT|nr:DUF2723 domain-containing protein [Taibaiella chishuiensis]PSK94985.1 uncharacterized protein DUF2723 [Taibaiella chishuiensis]
MNFKKVNNIAGWLVFAIAYAVYLLTMEATVSLWDCGEFLSTAYRLEVGHSPGAPLFMMLGRIFSLFASSKEHVALLINSMSALMSGLTILFLFWTITHFARKLVAKEGEPMSTGNLVAIIGAGVVGALAYTFSDTFWFSAVEGEVYATSSFFTAIVFWAVLKWEHTADQPHADRWLILIFYLMGLSIGVHLLNLLTIPAIVFVYYFKRYSFNMRGAVLAFIIGCAVLGLVQFGIIQYLPIIASQFELLFVNTIGMPFFSGAIFFLLLLAAIMVLLVIWAKKKGKYLLQLGVLCFAFTTIGYSSYVSIVLRSKADVPIDMGNPDNVMTLIPYLLREQYGSQPILFGPDFDSKVTDVKDGRAIYAGVKKDGKDYYELVDHKPEYTYDKVRFFPRIHDFNDPGHVAFYRAYLGLSDTEEPTAMDNQKFFWGYQMNWMYWRYFMWNYVGRQNDVAGQTEAQNGNWISGIKPIDKFFGRGDIDLMPDSLKNNKARNQLYFLPFILGILGLVYQYKRDKQDTFILGLLFFFTGMAIQLFINNTPIQPRERDYSYVSTYAFAVWIGLGVLMVTDWFKKMSKGPAPAVIATLICIMAVPVLMAAQEWDDHDRSKKTIARDHAYNMLSSCDSNAILITYGDNDTYPLWYLQEIEGYRTDIRIINYNLLGTDWQNEQLNMKINNADSLPVIWQPEHYRGGKLSYLPYYEDPRIPKDRFFSLEEVIKFFTSDANKLPTRNGDRTSYLPTRNLMIPVDRNALLKSGLAKTADSANIPSEIRFVYNKGGAQRPDLALMNIIAGQAKTGWTRPIYMTDGTPNLGLDAYFQSEGVLRKFVPVNKPQIIQGLAPYTDIDKNLNLFMNKFVYGGAKGNNIYYDEKNRLVFLVYRQNTAELALSLVAENRNADAIKVLDHFMNNVSESSMPYDILPYSPSSMRYIIDAYYRAGAQDKARKYGNRVAKGISDQIRYYNSLGENSKDGMMTHLSQLNLSELNNMVLMANQAGDSATARTWGQSLQALAPGILEPQSAPR